MYNTIIHYFQVGADIANQKSYHDEKSTYQCFTSVFCPRLIRNVWSRRRFDSSSIIAHPVYIGRDRLNMMPRIRHISIS